MNKDNINIIIDAFKQLDKGPLVEHPDMGFTMETPFFHGGKQDHSGHNCGTAACIVGWADVLFGEDMGTLEDEFDIRHTIYAALVIPCQENGCRYNYRTQPEKFPLRAAIRVLQIFRDTGEVRWNEAIDNPWSPEDDAVPQNAKNPPLRTGEGE